jgi:hypothetical protein
MKYIINDIERFTKMFQKENYTQEKIQELLKLIDNPLNITVKLNKINEGIQITIIDNIINDRTFKSDYNGYVQYLINTCLSDFMGMNSDIKRNYIKKEINDNNFQ